MKTIIIFMIGMLLSYTGMTQDNVESQLASAESAYDSENLNDARYALQESLRELDIIIGKEILKLFPESFDDYISKKEEDEVIGNSGGLTGLNVSRQYFKSSDQPDYISLAIFNNSPMLAMVNSFLTNPLFMNTADDSQKVIRISGYKGLLTKQTINEEHVGYEIQIPFGQSLLTFNCDRINDESRVMSYLEKIDIKSISKLAGGN